MLIISDGGGISSKLIRSKGNVPWRGTRAQTHRRVLAMHAKLREAKVAAAAKAAAQEGEPPPPHAPEPDRLLAASEGVPQVTVVTPRKACVLQLINHHALIVSLDALTELHHRLTHERAVGFVSQLQEEGEAARDLRTVLAHAPPPPQQQQQAAP